MTITNKESINRLLNDPTIVRLYQYTNALSGLTAWAAFEHHHHDDTNVSPFVINRMTLKDEDGITEVGKELVA
jgi:hypothetical protein